MLVASKVQQRLGFAARHGSQALVDRGNIHAGLAAFVALIPVTQYHSGGDGVRGADVLAEASSMTLGLVPAVGARVPKECNVSEL
mmetsp:Transcript_17977/g.35158  ORF Transcript_17977/g.35158 Transcript_17977/m.35158 type:complete len:85 (+) Transcript_17977:895-1149(+)